MADSTNIQTLLDHAWLNLGDVSELHLVNPCANWTPEEMEDPVRKVLRFMRNPDYFAMTCKLVFNIQLLPLQLVTLWELWNKPFPMLIGSRGLGKSFILALYAMLRALLCQGCKIVVVGAAFRQAKVIFEYCEHIWDNAPILRDLIGTQGRSGPRRDIDRCTMILGDSVITFLPLGDGTKIRGQRANYIIADEFAAIPRDIFETVVSGFSVVSMDPVEKVKHAAKVKLLKEKGLWSQELEAHEQQRQSNQVVISGTAYYDFNHFADYWKRWKSIIESMGDRNKLAEIFGGEENIDPSFNWRDYTIIRLPVELLPDGFMDAKQVARSKATVHSGIFQMEFAACFATDSNGFYRRKLIQSCVVGQPGVAIELPGTGEINFTASLRGNPRGIYVFGVDPASEQDNFSIDILECHDTHRRIVYCWSTNRRSFKEKIKHGLIQEMDYYGYCARKLRELMKAFPCVRIAIDSQGGAVAVMEALNDKDKMLEGEQPIWPIVVEDEEKDTDNYVGLHILDIINFAKADWVGEANHGMRKDFEDKALLFPHYDPLSIVLAAEDDKRAGRVKTLPDGSVIPMYDTLEDAVMEIEELKDELATIIMTQTPNGRDRWDTPEVKLPGNKKGRLRKDRYSALLMANMAARTLARTPPSPAYRVAGGWAKDIAEDHRQRPRTGQLYHNAPEWAQMNAGGFGRVVRR